MDVIKRLFSPVDIMTGEYKLSMHLFCWPPPFYVDIKSVSLVPVNQIVLFEIVLYKSIPEYLNISSDKPAQEIRATKINGAGKRAAHGKIVWSVLLRAGDWATGRLTDSMV